MSCKPYYNLHLPMLPNLLFSPSVLKHVTGPRVCRALVFCPNGLSHAVAVFVTFAAAARVVVDSILVRA